MEVLKIPVHEAIRLFNDSRPPGIHKEFVIHDLFNRYGDQSKTEQAQDQVTTDFIEREVARIKDLNLE